LSLKTSEVRHFLRIIRGAPRPDVAVLLLTFILTVFVDLVVAVNVGVILATLSSGKFSPTSSGMAPRFCSPRFV
jgi:MFS superfamily sulfate permease-like transporter